ncbi:acyltransferase [Halovenus amylolytica]|uniref:acyltransferase n=1 Tax=Halovenus amylolytica TaxID=2500550 RepID=UPI002FC44FAB
MVRISNIVMRVLQESGILDSVVGTITDYRKYAENEYYRHRIQETAETVGPGLYVDGETHVNAKTKIGKGAHFHGLNIRREGPVTIGDNFHAGDGCEIITATHNYDYGEAIPYDDSFVVDEVIIEDNVWFGINVTVLPGVTIGEGAIIQAGSVVVDDIPARAIAGGHPARVFKRRDREHYERLKVAGKFK